MDSLSGANLPPIRQPEPAEAGKVFGHLGLSQTALKELGRISQIARMNMLRADQDGSRNDIHAKLDSGANRKTEIALEALGLSLEKISKGQEAQKEEYVINRTDIDDFAQEIELLFPGEEAIQGAIKDLREGKVDFERSRIKISQCITNLIKNKKEDEKKLSEEKTLYGIQTVANLLRGFKVKSLLNGACNTHALLSTLHKSMEELIGSKETFVKNPELRREVYGNIKILQEKTQDLITIEKARRGIFPLSIFSKKHIAKLNSKCEEIKGLVDQYYTKLNFTPDEVDKFHDLSIEAHRPTRNHLMIYVEDIVAGAERLVEEKKPSELNNFKETMQRLIEQAKDDPRIGNGKLRETLSANAKEWKEQQKQAKEGIQEIFNEIKSAYIELFDNKNEKEASKELTEARDAVLASRGWGTPIDRDLEVPTGPAAIAKGIFGKIKLKHIMTCLNTGYPSGANRGRKAEKNSILPNFHRVQLQDSDKNLLCDYTSSATNVEFFQKNDDERAKATLQQTGEILLSKVDKKKTDGKGETPNNPIVVDVMATLLLSPDSVRGWINQNEWVKHGLVKLAGKSLEIDPSQLERQMLEESLKAWMSFDKDSTAAMGKNEFEIGDRTLRLVDNTEPRKFVLREKDGTETYIQFNISCYNVGTNKWTQRMNDFAFGKSVETFVKGGAKVLHALGAVKEYKEGLGTKLEDEINEKAFKKDTERYITKLNEIENKTADLKKNIDKNGQALISSFEEQTAKLDILRGELAKAERGMEGVDPKLAFANWQELRKSIAIELVKALNRKDLNDDVKQSLNLIQHQEDLKDLYNEIKDQLELQDFRSPESMKENMYSLPSALVAFGVELDLNPHTGCRSGKDRTSLQRMEIATRFALKEAHGRHLNYREMEQTPNTFETREQMLLNSGHIDELAGLNIGSSGLNLSGSYGNYLKNFGRPGEVIESAYEKPVLYGAKEAFPRILK